MNSRNKRKLAYRAKNEKKPTLRMVYATSIGDYLYEGDNHKDIDRINNANRNSRMRNSYAGGVSTHLHTRKYACNCQKSK